MKITSFQLTIQQSVDQQGYGDNFYISIDDEGLANISRPYKSIPVEEHLAIEEVITSAIKAHLKLVKQVDTINKDLKLEEYAPIESAEEEKGVAAAKLSAQQELEEETLEELDKKTFARLKEARESEARESEEHGTEVLVSK